MASSIPRMCRPSAIYDDWVLKGFHVHVASVELAVRPGHRRGMVVLKRVFRSDTQTDVNAAVRLLTLTCLSSAVVRQRWAATLGRAMDYLKWVRRRPAREGERPEVRVPTVAAGFAGLSGGVTMATLREFLTVGRLGPVQLGMTTQTVARHLGPPDTRSVSARPVDMWKYGAVQLAFKPVPQTTDARLVSMAAYFGSPTDPLPAPAVFDDWLPTGGTTVAEFRTFAQGIGLAVHARVDEENTQLTFDTGGTAAFDDGRLHSVHYSRADKVAARRQLSVSLPETTLVRLRERARQEHVSLRKLVEQVLSASA